MPVRSRRLVALGFVVLVALSGCAERTAPPSRPASVAPTPIGKLNAASLTLARVDFCELVPAAAIRAALGGAGPTQDRSWRNGEPTTVDVGIRDVVHEFGCGWSRTGYDAEAWVFARPVGKAFAQSVLDKTSKRKGCTATPGPSFGTPGQRQVCTQPDGGRRDRLSGLFGDTWLTCQVSGPASEATARLDARADAWCVQIANATNTTR